MFKRFFVVLTIFCMIFLTACQQPNTYQDKVSQLRYDILSGESNSYSVKAYLEKRENPYKADGIIQEMKNYVIFKINFKTEPNSITGELKINFTADKEYSSSLIYKPEFDSYVATIEVQNLPIAPLTATITLLDAQENVTLNSICNDVIKPEKALDTAITNKKELIEELEKTNADYEIMVRLICQEQSVYYYVGIVENEYTTALLISNTGKILAEKRIRNQ